MSIHNPIRVHRIALGRRTHFYGSYKQHNSALLSVVVDSIQLLAPMERQLFDVAMGRHVLHMIGSNYQ